MPGTSRFLLLGFITAAFATSLLLQLATNIGYGRQRNWSERSSEGLKCPGTFPLSPFVRAAAHLWIKTKLS